MKIIVNNKPYELVSYARKNCVWCAGKEKLCFCDSRTEGYNYIGLFCPTCNNNTAWICTEITDSNIIKQIVYSFVEFIMNAGININTFEDIFKQSIEELCVKEIIKDQ